MLALTSAAQAADLTRAERDRMLAADIVLLGEIHDNPAHHLIQAEMIEALEPTAVVFEMLSPAQAAEVNADDKSNLTALGAKIGWEAAGWPPFSLYVPIFAALGDTPVIGAASPRAEIRAAFQGGAAAVFGLDAATFGLHTPLPDPEREARAEMQFEAHCRAMPRDMMGGMIEAQRLRDARFSAATLEALARFGPPVAVITGNGHARRDWGMPALIATAAPEVTVFALGLLEAPAAPDDDRFDATLITPPAERDDPCAAFSN
ncbi:MAG: ChaN family lipoprotein [Sulfitobacter sp.]|nr:ChaN family lipoprotein [Sulfitobacter sp.]